MKSSLISAQLSPRLNVRIFPCNTVSNIRNIWFNKAMSICNNLIKKYIVPNFMILAIGIAKYLCKILLITVLCLSISWVHARTPANLAIQGYSPISYFEKNKAEMGLAEFNVKYKGKTYWFASADQVSIFNADPTQYLPISDAFCAYSLTLGHTVPIDPTNFKIVAGRLLLFHQSDAGDGLKKWNRSDNEEELLHRAKNTLLNLEF